MRMGHLKTSVRKRKWAEEVWGVLNMKQNMEEYIRRMYNPHGFIHLELKKEEE